MKHRPRKRFGQNFLVDDAVISDIVAIIQPKLDEHVVEIGPGLGALTKRIIKQCHTLSAIEIDRDLATTIREQLPEVNLHTIDALKFDFAQLEPKPLRIIGNLPYNISTPLLFHLIDHIDCIKDMHFMLQNEVVLRLTAKPNTKNYGRLGIMVQYFCQTSKCLDIGPDAFNPPPQVDSAIIQLIPHKTLPHQANDFNAFAKLVTQCFNHRRKTLGRILKNDLKGKEVDLPIDLSHRPEQLSIADFVALSNCLIG